jgi:large subunit ribosomal protein L28
LKRTYIFATIVYLKYKSLKLIIIMSKVCQLTGKRPLTGNNVSHANNRTKRRQLPNLKNKRIWVPEENRFVTLKISTSALRTLKKKGYSAMMAELKQSA